MRSALGLMIAVLAGSATAGVIDSNLNSRLAAASSDTRFRVIAILDGQAEVAELARDMRHEGWARRDRHEKVVRALERRAHETQGPILKELHHLGRDGGVHEVTPLWIVNAVAFEGTPVAIRRVASLGGISEVVEDALVVLDRPVESRPAPPTAQGYPWGITYVKAPQLWALGITGEGTVVCNLDTGVDGSHPALASRWRGASGGEWKHHWFDPSLGSSFPNDDDSHGTHTMGIMLGSVAGDTVGVAPGAEWIAALTIGGQGDFVAKTLLALQWAADPDENPATDDSPDVICNAWTDLQAKCQNTLYQAIDNVESAGAAVVFSAGNSGPSPRSITSPKNRAATPVNIWATGAMGISEKITSFSSRGPSYCDANIIKPEVVAPGEIVRSCVPGNEYDFKSGTSMAAPHVAGAIALLRQVSPDVDPETVKTVLLETAIDLGEEGEDNDYGMGLIDVFAAYEALASGYGYLAGRVSDGESSDPIPAKIVVVGTPRKTWANSEGLFSISLPGDSTHVFSAGIFGYETESWSTHIAAGDTSFRHVRLDASARGLVEGVVRGPIDAPAAGAVVTVANTPLDPVQTLADGTYAFPDVPGDSTYTLVASLCGFADDSTVVFIPANGSVQADLQLGALGDNDMESGAVGWSHAPVTVSYGDQWHLSTRRNHTPQGTTAWKCGSVGVGDYDDLIDSGLVTPCFDLQPGSVLRFWHWMAAEDDGLPEAWDGGFVEASDNGVDFEQIVPVGGYPYTILDNPASPFEPGTPCWSGDFTWKRATFDLRSRVGTTWFRFRFGSDGNTTDEGWYVDDLVVMSDRPPVRVQVSGVPESAQPGETVTWTIGLSNGDSEAQVVDLWLEIAGPRGTVKRELMKGIPLAAGSSGYREISLGVPESVREGIYTVSNIVGLNETPYDIDEFECRVGN